MGVLAKVRMVMQSEEHAAAIAAHIEAAYYKGIGETAPLFEPTQANIAMNLAGFYALECAIGAIAERRGISVERNFIPILKQIVHGTLPKNEMLLAARFANATWKAGVPFRSLDRITRSSFIPASLLPKEQLEKDFVQIVAAAEYLLEQLTK